MGFETNRRRKPSFFKVMMGDFSNQLRIPPDFVKNLKDDCYVLRNFNGRTWQLKVCNSDGNLFFGGGWKGFVEDNSIEFGDFVVFTYAEGLTFEVTIYGKNGCEKESVLSNGDQNEPRSQEIKEEQGSSKYSSEVKPSEKSISQFIGVVGKKLYMMNIPEQVARENRFRKRRRAILRDPKQRKWVIKVNHSSHLYASLGSGWKDFRDGNNLKTGDTCLFTINSAKELIIDVKFFRGNSLQ